MMVNRSEPSGQEARLARRNQPRRASRLIATCVPLITATSSLLTTTAAFASDRRCRLAHHDCSGAADGPSRVVLHLDRGSYSHILRVRY